MGSFQDRFRAAPPVRTRESVFAVGRRVYVACAGDRLAHVALTDDAGADAWTRLADGTEVEILAWRPRGSHGTRYRVRVTRDGREGWLAVDNLRSTPSADSLISLPPVATDPAPLRVTASGDSRDVGSARVWADKDGIEGSGRGRSTHMTIVGIARGPVST